MSCRISVWYRLLFFCMNSQVNLSKLNYSTFFWNIIHLVSFLLNFIELIKLFLLSKRYIQFQKQFKFILFSFIFVIYLIFFLSHSLFSFIEMKFIQFINRKLLWQRNVGTWLNMKMWIFVDSINFPDSINMNIRWLNKYFQSVWVYHFHT